MPLSPCKDDAPTGNGVAHVFMSEMALFEVSKTLRLETLFERIVQAFFHKRSGFSKLLAIRGHRKNLSSLSFRLCFPVTIFFRFRGLFLANHLAFLTHKKINGDFIDLDYLYSSYLRWILKRAIQMFLQGE